MYVLLLFAASSLVANGYSCTSGSLECLSASQMEKSATLTCDFSQEGNASHGDCEDGQFPCCVASTAANHDMNAGSLQSAELVDHMGAVIWLAALCLLIALAASYICYKRNYRGPEASATQTVSTLDVERHRPEILIEGQPQCVICLVEIAWMGRKLQCGHCYHTDCILNWWMHVPRVVLECPICKQVQTLPETMRNAKLVPATKGLTGSAIP